MSGRPVKKGTLNVSSVVRIIDSTDGTPELSVTAATGGLAFNYRREKEVAVAITALNDLSALTDAHTNGGILHIGDGYYRIDFQDTAFAAGTDEDGVLLTGTATGMIVIGTYHPLVDYDPYDAVRLGLTAMPDAAANAPGGLPTSTAGSLDLDAILADTNELQGDWADAGRLDTILDARASQTTADAIETDTQDIQSRIPAALSSGNMKADMLALNGNTTSAANLERSASTLIRGAATAVTLSTTTMSADGFTEATDDHFNGRIIIWTSGDLLGQATDITDYTGATQLFTFTAVTEAPSNNDEFVIV